MGRDASTRMIDPRAFEMGLQALIGERRSPILF